MHSLVVKNVPTKLTQSTTHTHTQSHIHTSDLDIPGGSRSPRSMGDSVTIISTLQHGDRMFSRASFTMNCSATYSDGTSGRGGGGVEGW